MSERTHTKWLDKQVLEHFPSYHTEFSLLFQSPLLIIEVWGLVIGLHTIKSRFRAVAGPGFTSVCPVTCENPALVMGPLL